MEAQIREECLIWARLLLQLLRLWIKKLCFVYIIILIKSLVKNKMHFWINVLRSRTGYTDSTPIWAICFLLGAGNWIKISLHYFPPYILDSPESFTILRYWRKFSMQVKHIIWYRVTVMLQYTACNNYRKKLSELYTSTNEALMEKFRTAPFEKRFK